MAALLGDCAKAGMANTHIASTERNCLTDFIASPLRKKDLLLRTVMNWALLASHDEILEVAGAVALGPEAHTAGHRRAKHRVVGGEEVRVRRVAVAARTRLPAERIFQREGAIE
jgi:hypothetical protein